MAPDVVVSIISYSEDRNMKALIRAASVAALALPLALQAQAPFDPTVMVNVTSHARPTTGTGYASNLVGGGFLANFTVNFSASSSATLVNHLVWCIDWTRGINVPISTNYQAFTLAGFANTNLGANGNDPDILDMRAIASQAADLEDNWVGAQNAFSQNAQGVIWNRFTQIGGTGGNESFVGADWYVLWNGQTQTFITRIPEGAIVPEPATFALLGAGFVGLLAVRRRRA